MSNYSSQADISASSLYSLRIGLIITIIGIVYLIIFAPNTTFKCYRFNQNLGKCNLTNSLIGLPVKQTNIPVINLRQAQREVGISVPKRVSNSRTGQIFCELSYRATLLTKNHSINLKNYPYTKDQKFC